MTSDRGTDRDGDRRRPSSRAAARSLAARRAVPRRAARVACASTRRPTSTSRRRPRKPRRCAQWHRTLHAGRWVGIHWPVEYGGRGASPAQTAIYNEELARAGAPPLLGRGGLSLVGPTLDGARHRGATAAVDPADPRRRRRLVPAVQRTRRGQRPRQPHDARREARRRLRRERAEGVVVVRGRSRTGPSRWCAPTRTRPTIAGISMLAIPMTANGVDIRPLRQITGKSEFNEVFLDDVEVPVENLIGPEHEGWRVDEHDARQRARRLVRVEGAGAPRVGDGPADEGVRAPRHDSATRSCASGSCSRGSRSRSSACTTRAR